VPDWRTAPLSIWDSWASAARWVVDQMPAEKFALAGLSLGGMLAVEIMQFASDRVTKLALLDTGMRSQSEAERCDPAGPASGWRTKAISSWSSACR
jgi:pimeloyl-ACP methyl ester carboxylesterase